MEDVVPEVTVWDPRVMEGYRVGYKGMLGLKAPLPPLSLPSPWL